MLIMYSGEKGPAVGNVWAEKLVTSRVHYLPVLVYPKTRVLQFVCVSVCVWGEGVGWVVCLALGPQFSEIINLV